MATLRVAGVNTRAGARGRIPTPGLRPGGEDLSQGVASGPARLRPPGGCLDAELPDGLPPTRRRTTDTKRHRLTV